MGRNWNKVVCLSQTTDLDKANLWDGLNIIVQPPTKEKLCKNLSFHLRFQFFNMLSFADVMASSSWLVNSRYELNAH